VFGDASRISNQSVRSVFSCFVSPTVSEEPVVLHRSAQLIDTLLYSHYNGFIWTFSDLHPDIGPGHIIFAGSVAVVGRRFL
jgi:hypothetical protein